MFCCLNFVSKEHSASWTPCIWIEWIFEKTFEYRIVKIWIQLISTTLFQWLRFDGQPWIFFMKIIARMQRRKSLSICSIVLEFLLAKFQERNFQYRETLGINTNPVLLLEEFGPKISSSSYTQSSMLDDSQIGPPKIVGVWSPLMRRHLFNHLLWFVFQSS